ncbi:MAG: low temperature-induced protein [Oscillatoriales cyanobacterium]|nr:MAG: low temperature-induced protein [Oscillatoriales cyanobacterium]TAH26682.1 MAG: low temperature-induced protein [Oscillatoriales cyanobacterium]
MSLINFNLPINRLVRSLITVCFCALMFVSNAFPALAITSSPTKGTDQLLGIEKDAQKAVLREPMSMEETEKKANQGINEIQGDDDKEKMKNPSNTRATSFKQQVEKAVSQIKKD